MQCHVGPYEGSDAYACFISCADDAGIAYPMVERLARQGMRLWYDTFDSDDIGSWLAKVRQKLQNCAAVIVLLSNQAVASHLCRERLTEAVELKKPLIVVRHGQSVISPAMRMQVERGTCLESDLIPSEGVVTSILQNPSLQQCKGLADARIVVQPYQPDGEADAGETPGPASIDPSEETIREIKKRTASVAPVTKQPAPVPAKPQPTVPAQPQPTAPAQPHPTAPVRPEPVETTEVAPRFVAPAQSKTAQPAPVPAAPQPTAPAQPEPLDLNATVPRWQAPPRVEPSMPLFEGDGEETVRSTPARPPESDFGESTIVIAPHPRANIAIVSMKTGEIQLSGWRDDVLVGRKGKRQDGVADIAIQDECKLFSRTHFRAVSVDGVHSIVCAHANGITVNGQDLGQDESIQVEDFAEVVAPNRSVLAYYGSSAGEPATLLVSFGKVSEKVRDATTVACLTSVETGETQYFFDEPFELGKSYPWKTGAVALGTISRKHATIHHENGQYILEDHSTNGTDLNGEHLNNGDRRPLTAGDEIVIEGNREMNIRTAHFIFRCVTVERTTAL